MSNEKCLALIPGMMPENPPEDYADVNAILLQFGLMDLFAGQQQVIHSSSNGNMGKLLNI